MLNQGAFLQTSSLTGIKSVMILLRFCSWTQIFVSECPNDHVSCSRLILDSKPVWSANQSRRIFADIWKFSSSQIVTIKLDNFFARFLVTFRCFSVPLYTYPGALCAFILCNIARNSYHTFDFVKASCSIIQQVPLICFLLLRYLWFAFCS